MFNIFKKNVENKSSDELVQEASKRINKLSFFLMITILAGIVYFCKPTDVAKSYVTYYFTIGACVFGFLGYVLISTTISWKTAFSIMKAKRLKKKGYGFIKIMNLSGIPEYKVVKFEPLIPYEFKENGEIKKKCVVFEKFAITEEFGIPTITCNPNDILPINMYNGSRITISPELIEKNIVDNSKSAETIAQYKKYIMWGLIVIAILAGITFLSFDLYGQRLGDASIKLAECYKSIPKEAVILAQNLSG